MTPCARILTRAHHKSGNFVATEGCHGDRQAQVLRASAEVFDVTERGGDLMVVSVELPQSYQLAVDSRVNIGKHSLFN